jgi:PPOX class probable F420-dependent enzyme
MSPRLDVSMSVEEVHEFLDASKVAVLTTLGADGWPHAAGMWYVRSGDTLHMWTHAKSQKARNLMRDGRCAAVVESGVRYDELKGVLIQAMAELIDNNEEIAVIGRRLYERYTQPVTGIPYDSGPSVEIERQAHKRIGIALSLATLASWDHSKLA